MIIQIEPWIDEEERKQLNEVVNSTFVTEWKKTEEFEKKIKEITGARHVIAYCNGTMALYAALKYFGIAQGDEVIVPDLTFVASSNSIIMAGATPVFVDIDKKTFQINPKEIEKHITKKTKAIMPVHLYGQSCEMDEIIRIAKKHNLKVIEDAAQGIGVKFNGKHVGTFGDVGVLSFYGNKTITTGEGGIILTNNDIIAKEVYLLKNHGREKKGMFIHEKIGFNFSFTEMQAAVGLAQLNKFNEIKRKKEEIRKKYEEGLKGITEIKLSFIEPKCEPVHWFTNIIVPDAEVLEKYLNEQGIQTRRFFYPLHMQPCYAHIKTENKFPNAEYAYKTSLSLPSAATLKEEEILFVIKKIREFYRK